MKKWMHAGMVGVIAGWGVLGAAGALGAEPPKYRVTFIGENTAAFALNEVGDCAGWVVPPGGNTRAIVAKSGKAYEILPLPVGYTSSGAYDINDAGWVVGAVSTFTHPTFSPQAALWREVNGVWEVTLLGGLPGEPYSAAVAVNNLGDIVGGTGYVSYGSYWNHGVLFTAGGAEPIADYMSATDVNDNRDVLSGTQYYNLDTQQKTIIGSPPGNWAGHVTADLNNFGEMCGWIANWSSSCMMFPNRYTLERGWETIGGCANYTSATAINDLGDTLTFVEYTASRVQFEGIGDFPIGSLIDPRYGTWYVTWGGANDINNRRQILAGVMDATFTKTGAAVLTPVKTPKLVKPK